MVKMLLSSIESSANHPLRNIMPTLTHALSHPGNRHIR